LQSHSRVTLFIENQAQKKENTNRLMLHLIIMDGYGFVEALQCCYGLVAVAHNDNGQSSFGEPFVVIT